MGSVDVWLMITVVTVLRGPEVVKVRLLVFVPWFWCLRLWIKRRKWKNFQLQAGSHIKYQQTVKQNLTAVNQIYSSLASYRWIIHHQDCTVSNFKLGNSRESHSSMNMIFFVITRDNRHSILPSTCTRIHKDALEAQRKKRKRKSGGVR